MELSTRSAAKSLALACLAAAATLASCATTDVQDSGEAGVECTWLCYCGRTLGDCDSQEDKFETCIDIQSTRHPTTVASCDECREVAEAACGARRCPPDPASSKFIWRYFCDGRRQQIAAEPETPDASGMTTAGIAFAAPEDDHQVDLSFLDKEVADRRVTCEFGCYCSVGLGLCDEQEQRAIHCSDKVLQQVDAPNCIVCQARAQLACLNRNCPLAEGADKVVTRFRCPVG